MKNKEAIRKYGKLMNLIKGWDLEYSFESIDFCLMTESVSIEQVREAVFLNEEETNTITNAIRATKIALEMGLYHKFKDYNTLCTKAEMCMEAWRALGYDINLLHLILIRYMEEKHFFMGGQDEEILTVLAQQRVDSLLLSKIAKLHKNEELEQLRKALKLEEKTS